MAEKKDSELYRVAEKIFDVGGMNPNLEGAMLDFLILMAADMAKQAIKNDPDDENNVSLTLWAVSIRSALFLIAVNASDEDTRSRAKSAAEEWPGFPVSKEHVEMAIGRVDEFLNPFKKDMH